MVCCSQSFTQSPRAKDPRFHFCPRGAPRIYIYDTEMSTTTPLSCARSGFWASEVYIHRFLQRSTCRTFDPEEAQLFFELQAATPVARQQRLRRAAETLRQLPWRRRREGLDHVALFGASAWQLPGWRELLRNSIVLAVESEPIESDGIPEAETLCRSETVRHHLGWDEFVGGNHSQCG
eukprot:s605_g6.t1